MPATNTDSQPSVLVVSAAADLKRDLVALLSDHHWQVSATESGAETLRLLGEGSFDAVVIDRVFPDGLGLDLYRRIRGLGLPQPVIVLVSERPDEIDRIVALELGADDYLHRPFHPRELALRIRARLGGPRSTTKAEAKPRTLRFQVGSLVLDEDQIRVESAGEAVTLSPIEFRILLRLAQAEGAVVPRDRLRTDIWPTAQQMSDRTVDKHIQRLRERLGVARRYLRTIRGLGYQLAE